MPLLVRRRTATAAKPITPPLHVISTPRGLRVTRPEQRHQTLPAAGAPGRAGKVVISLDGKRVSIPVRPEMTTGELFSAIVTSLPAGFEATKLVHPEKGMFVDF